jgi:8-oxo-dGTP pyrophosphatase MutT (NUDIX family)
VDKSTDPVMIAIKASLARSAGPISDSEPPWGDEATHLANVLVYKNNGSEVLLQYHDGLKGWHLVGGHIELGETPAVAVVRETQEEAGLSISVGTEFKSIEANRPTGPVISHVFKATVPDETMAENTDPEASALRWFLKGDVVGLSPKSWLLEAVLADI